MSEWLKVFPSAADKIFVSQVDSDSPTGFGLVEKSISEMKTLLGLPSKIYKALINTTGTNPPVVSELVNTFSGTLTWSRSDVGILSLISADSEFTNDQTIIHVTMRRTSLSTIVVAEDAYEIVFRLYNDSSALADGLDFFITIETYE